MAQLRKFAGRGAFAQHLLDRIAGHDVNHQEYEGQHQPERRQGHAEIVGRNNAAFAIGTNDTCAGGLQSRNLCRAIFVSLSFSC